MLFEHTSNTSDMMGMSCCYWLLVSVWILSDSCTTTASMERDTVLQELPLLTLSPSHPLPAEPGVGDREQGIDLVSPRLDGREDGTH